MHPSFIIIPSQAHHAICTLNNFNHLKYSKTIIMHYEQVRLLCGTTDVLEHRGEMGPVGPGQCCGRGLLAPCRELQAPGDRPLLGVGQSIRCSSAGSGTV